MINNIVIVFEISCSILDGLGGTMKLGKCNALLSLLPPKCWGFAKFYLFLFCLLILLYRLLPGDLVHFFLYANNSQLSTSLQAQAFLLTFTYLNVFWTSLPGYSILKFIIHIMKLFFSTKCPLLSPFSFSLLVPRSI